MHNTTFPLLSWHDDISLKLDIVVGFLAEDSMLKLVCERAKVEDGNSIMVCTFA